MKHLRENNSLADQYKDWVNKNKTIDIPGESDDIDYTPLELISFIKDVIYTYSDGSLTMADLEASSSPIYKEDSDGIHLIERLHRDGVDVIVYGGHNNEQEITDYDLIYDHLETDTLIEIKNELEIAIESEIIEERENLDRR